MSAKLLRTPDDREQLIDLLRRSQERDLLDAEALAMIEGVLQVAERCAADIMVPRAQMDVIDLAQSREEVLSIAIHTARSRIPVIDGERDNVVGLLYAKDLLRLSAVPETPLRELIRPAWFVPGTLRLNVLLRDFRESRRHLAIVVDEYGGTAGLITIEDVLEQIVGDIEDEFDLDPGTGDMVALPDEEGVRRWRVRALTPLDQFAAYFQLELEDTPRDTVGGWVTDRLGRMPHTGDRLLIEGLAIEVLRADPRTVSLLSVERLAPQPDAALGQPALAAD